MRPIGRRPSHPLGLEVAKIHTLQNCGKRADRGMNLDLYRLPGGGSREPLSAAMNSFGQLRPTNIYGQTYTFFGTSGRHVGTQVIQFKPGSGRRRWM